MCVCLVRNLFRAGFRAKSASTRVTSFNFGTPLAVGMIGAQTYSGQQRTADIYHIPGIHYVAVGPRSRRSSVLLLSRAINSYISRLVWQSLRSRTRYEYINKYYIIPGTYVHTLVFVYWQLRGHSVVRLSKGVLLILLFHSKTQAAPSAGQDAKARCSLHLHHMLLTHRPSLEDLAGGKHLLPVP